MSIRSSKKFISVEKPKQADVSAFGIIIRSFHRRIIAHLWMDVEEDVISPKILLEISHDIKKAASA